MSSDRENRPLLTIEGLLPPHLVGTKALASDYIHLNLGRGESLVAFGPKGSGKGELLACLAGLRPPQKGKVLYQGKPLTKPTGRFSSMVPKVPGVYEELQAWEYLEFFADAYNVDEYYRRPMIEWALKTCDLQDKGAQRVSNLTFALRKRLSLARAILCDPHILYLDDPFFRLDRAEQTGLKQVLSKIQERGTTIVSTAPSLGELSDLASHLCVLTSKSVLAYGPANHLRANLSCFKMMQVQFETGFGKAIRVLDEEPNIFHLNVASTNLVRFLLKGTDLDLTTLLKKMANEGASIVSYVEDQDFMGRGGRRLPR